MAELNKQLAFAVDQEILDVIEELKKELGAKTAAAVFRKSLAIAKMAAKQAKDSDGIVTIRGFDQGKESEVAVSLKT